MPIPPDYADEQLIGRQCQSCDYSLTAEDTAAARRQAILHNYYGPLFDGISNDSTMCRYCAEKSAELTCYLGDALLYD